MSARESNYKIEAVENKLRMVKRVKLSSTDHHAKSFIGQSDTHWIKVGIGSAFHGTLAIVMNDVRALFSLQRIVLTDINKTFNDEIEGIVVVVVKNQFSFTNGDLFQLYDLFGLNI
jgi:hypothetical protein